MPMTAVAPAVDAPGEPGDPSPAQQRRRWQMCAAGAGAGLVLRIVAHFTVLDSVVDDAYIFFRYARHGAAGDGLVYNLGHHVLGFSSPLYTLLLTALARVFGPSHLPGLSVVIGLAGYVAASVVLCRLAVGHRAGIAVVALWALALPFVDGSLNGMETTLFAALVLLVIHELEHGRGDTALVAAAGAALTRPEGFLVAIAAVAIVARRGRPWPWRGAAVAVVGLGAWLGYATIVYGSPVPQSITGKVGHSAGLPSLGGPLGIAAQLAFGISTSTFASMSTPARVGLELVALAGAVLCAWQAVRLVRAGRGTALFPLTYLLVAVSYAVGHPVHIWTWYTVVPALCWAWSVIAALAEVAAGYRWPTTAEPAFAALVALVAVATLAVGAPRRQHVNTSDRASFAAISTAIAQLRPPPRVVMLGDIGLVGWQNQAATIVDLSGLVSTEPAARVNGTVPSLGRLIDESQPDVVVLHRDQPIPGSVVEGSRARLGFDTQAQALRFTQQYTLVPIADKARALYVRAGRG
jgi:hypothetical protein